jgi:hypothetical protein
VGDHVCDPPEPWKEPRHRAAPSKLCDLHETCPHFYARYALKIKGIELPYETCHGTWNFNCPLSPGGRDADQAMLDLPEGEAR